MSENTYGCISCGIIKDLDMYGHRNLTGRVVGIVFSCAACKERVAGMSLSLLPEGIDDLAYEYAKDLATSIWKVHYKGDPPDWEPCEDLMGVLTQIDNMVTGMMDVKSQI